ncbi:MAG: single-stranded DNA-binding protein [Candidatus Liptonbacteria bacterium]
MNLNKVMLIGRVTAQPELRTTSTGQAVSSFGIATNRVWNAKDGSRKEDTEFHNVVVWGRQAEIASQFLAKGQMVFVEGRLQTRSWQDKQGATRKTTEIICERFQLGPKAANAGGAQGGGNASVPAGNAGGANGTNSQGNQDVPAIEELPTIDLEEDMKAEEIKPEDIPF